MELNIEAVRQAVKDSGFTSAHIAKKIGVDRSTVTRFKNGQTRLGRSALILLLQVLDLNPEALLQKAS